MKCESCAPNFLARLVIRANSLSLAWRKVDGKIGKAGGVTFSELRAIISSNLGMFVFCSSCVDGRVGEAVRWDINEWMTTIKMWCFFCSSIHKTQMERSPDSFSSLDRMAESTGVTFRVIGNIRNMSQVRSWSVLEELEWLLQKRL